MVCSAQVYKFEISALYNTVVLVVTVVVLGNSGQDCSSPLAPMSSFGSISWWSTRSKLFLFGKGKTLQGVADVTNNRDANERSWSYNLEQYHISQLPLHTPLRMRYPIAH